MTAPLLFPFVYREFDNAGLPAAGYHLWTYAAGGTVPKATYSDAAGTVPNTNPVVLDTTGSAVIRLGSGAYNLVLKDPTDTTTIKNADNYQSYLTSADIGTTIFPTTTAEAGTVTNNLYPYGNALRYGIVPNSSGAAAANTTALKALVSYGLHNTGWTGNLVFPNTTGADVYYFSNYIDFRPGIDVDLNWSTLNFTKAADGTDPNSGFVSAIRDFTIKNGYIVVNFTCANGGHGLMFGARGADGTYFVPMYDAAYLAATGCTMGNIRVNNVKVSSNNPGNRCIFMFGGLQDVSFENVWMDGASVADGCYYEFGWATDAGGVLANRQTSHAHNLSFKNIKATNLGTSAGMAALQCNGAYNWSVDGLKVITAACCVAAGFGESYFYNPWASVDDGQVNKRGVTVRNVVGKGIQGIGIGIVGANASAVASGYLAATINALATPAKWVAQTDLTSAIIDGFDMNGTANNNGIQVQGAQQLKISNGRVVGFQKGINTTDEATLYSIDNVQVIGSTGTTGITIGNASDVFTPARLSIGEIKNCFIAGGAGVGITVGASQYCLIKGNRIGNELIHDGVAETTQTTGVLATATALNVICDGNYVNTSGGAVAYQKTSGPGGCQIINPMGLATLTGAWQYGGSPVMATLAYSASMTPDCTQASEFIVNPSNGVAFTINAPLNPMTGMLLTLSIRNATGGALGAVTWNAVFKLAAWTQPANTFNRSITYKYDGTNWIQVSQTGVDIPN
jgi:hypothetical protein